MVCAKQKRCHGPLKPNQKDKNLPTLEHLHIEKDKKNTETSCETRKSCENRATFYSTALNRSFGAA